jgi:hypothetical protein
LPVVYAVAGRAGIGNGQDVIDGAEPAQSL